MRKRRTFTLLFHHNESNVNRFAFFFLGLLLFAAASPVFADSLVLDVCVDYGCDVERTVFIPNEQWRTIQSLFDDADSASSERTAVAKAIGMFEHIVGEQAGTSGDAAKNSAGYGGRGQLDCIAESINTERYLRLLETASLLPQHQVNNRVVRHPLLFNVHWTAVIRKTDSGKAFAVDSWSGKNGDDAYVTDLEEWRRGASP